MARPTKRGLDYFPLDCVQDDNLTFIEAKHGVEGFGILIKIWQKIYRNDGYYMQWNEQNMYLFAREIAVNMDVISSVVNTCLLPNIGIFNQGKYQDYGILTSTGIQKRWLSIVKSSKRKGAEIEPKFDLLEFPQEETKLSQEETPVSPLQSTQTKVNDIKVNETTREETENPPRDLMPLGTSSVYRSMNDVEFICLNQSSTWLEHMTRKLELKDLENAKKWVVEFFETMRAAGQDKRELNDARQHCFNWIKIQISKETIPGKKDKGKAEAVLEVYDASTQYWEKMKEEHLNNLNQKP